MRKMSSGKVIHSTARVLRGVSLPFVGFLKAQRLFFRRDSFLVSTGFMRSCAAGYPCRRDDSPLPWMNYATIHFLEERLTPLLSLFEYGSGHSTLFFARLVHSVVSIETDCNWFDSLHARCPRNVTLVYHTLEPDGAAYAKLVRRDGRKYDVVVIDGHDRERCSVHACASLTDGGVIILDDMQRASNQGASHYLRQAGFKRLDFVGPKPGGLLMERTSVFYRPQNCLGV